MGDNAEVGSGQVAIVPTFKGFRTSTAAEVDATTKASASSFTRGFTTAGTSAGRGFGTALSAASGPGLKAVQSDIARAAAAVSTARLKEADAAGKVRVAEATLAEARTKYASDSSQVVRAEERLASSERSLLTQQQSLTSSSARLSAARLGVSAAAETAATSGLRLNNVFGTLPSIFKVNGNASGQKFLTGFTDVLGGVVGANILTGVGFAVGRGINDVITGGIKTALSSISLASDLNETTSAITQVFGPDAAQGIVAFSKTADKSLAQTQQQALLGAQTFGVFGKAAGLQGSKLVGFSTGLVQLAGDLASFYNTTPDDAITAITAGLRGESEPLRQYGVLLDDASLRQEALRLRITKTTKDALTPQQRVLAAQSLILKQTTIAQGDFARTSGGLANSQRILSAEIANTQAQLGTFLLPAFTSFVHYAGATILPQADALIDKLGPQLATALQLAKPEVKKLLDQVGPLADKFGTMAVDAIPGAIGGLKDFIKFAGTAADAGKKVGDTFTTLNNGGLSDHALPGAPTSKQVNDSVGEFFGGLLDGFSGKNPVYNKNLKQLQGQIDDIFGAINSDPLNLQGGFKAGSDWTSSLTEGIQDGGKDKFFTAFQGLKADASGGLNDFNLWSFGAGKGAGDAFGQGMVEGMRGKSGPVAKAGSDLGISAIQGARLALRVASPSKAGIEIGQFFGDGQILGMRNRTAGVQAEAARMASSALVGAAFGSGAAGGSGGPAIYVQNPFTGEYLLSKVADVADVRVGVYDQAQSATQTRGSRGL